MEVDASIDKYDEYHQGFEREVVTVETKLKPTNKGFAMLAKMGWTEGQPVGLSGDGRVDPVPFYVKHDLTGLGKTGQDVRMIETTVSQRRGLDSERQQKETEEQRRLREDEVARRAALESELSTTLRAFYCSLCDKQFKNVAQYDEHTNSYAHHHKARSKDMQAAQKLMQGRGTQEDVEKRKEKEKKREEKELRKLAKAAGIRITKPGMTTTAGMDVDGKEDVPKKSGWATVSSLAAEPSAPTTSSSLGVKKSGWASVASPSTSTQPEVPQASGGWARVASPAQPSEPVPPPPPPSSVPNHPPHAAPSFRTGGWTSLDTTTPRSTPSHTPPPPSHQPGGWNPQVPAIVQPTPLHVPHLQASAGGGWPSSHSMSRPQQGGWQAAPASTTSSQHTSWNTTVTAALQQPPQGGWQSASGPSTSFVSTQPSEPVPSSSIETKPQSPGLPPPQEPSPVQRVHRPPPPAPEDKRSSWQQFRKKAYR
ncbi:hypothetical protein JAAARDRAFT_65852 [Jaapia argillacea MUCL 33604]|uniref:G-patch domain-containing protein n=1 Tax=Jaapia argillacea MUCL 33604 TaxID=933084 RepID=A0A067QMK3_9AGAM|nr:hypothetical protein JAAARDRAFT_65852 [Jaapia argillacea MUCL 33604]